MLIVADQPDSAAATRRRPARKLAFSAHWWRRCGWRGFAAAAILSRGTWCGWRTVPARPARPGRHGGGGEVAPSWTSNSPPFCARAPVTAAGSIWPCRPGRVLRHQGLVKARETSGGHPFQSAFMAKGWYAQAAGRGRRPQGSGRHVTVRLGTAERDRITHAGNSARQRRGTRGEPPCHAGTSRFAGAMRLPMPPHDCGAGMAGSGGRCHASARQYRFAGQIQGLS